MMADADDELAALMGGCSLGAGAPGFWTPDMVGYFELVKPIKAETESLFAAIGELARQQAAVVAGEAEGTPDQAMEAVGRLDAQLGSRCARAHPCLTLASRCVHVAPDVSVSWVRLGAVDAARGELRAQTAARLAALGGDATCVEMRIRANVDGSLGDPCPQTPRIMHSPGSAAPRPQPAHLAVLATPRLSLTMDACVLACVVRAQAGAVRRGAERIALAVRPSLDARRLAPTR